MVISILANGDIKNIIPENIYQGSNKANTIYVVAPFASNIKALISFEVATTGQIIPAILMDSPTSISNELNMWKVNVSQALTQYYGEVKYQVKFLNTEDVVVATARGKFRVQEGVDFDLPESPDEATYTLILQKLSDIEAHYLNGWIEAQALKVYNSEFAYSLNAFVFGEIDGKVYLCKSLVENNKGNELTDTESWERIELGVDAEAILKDAKEYTDQEIEKVVDGTTIVGKAERDSEGNIITAHYATQEQLLENMEAIENNAEQIKAVAQNITAIINGNIIAGKANNDGNGNNIAETYATKTENADTNERIDNVIDGTTPVQKANADGYGDIISSTYVKNTQITNTFGGTFSDKVVPSANLVRDTITNALGGGTTDLVFDTYDNFSKWVKNLYYRPDYVEFEDVKKIGLGILIKEEGYPDYWCSSVDEPYSVENNFTPFEAKIDVEDFLTKDNTTEYTPTGDYNPATKKYVDDKVGFVIYNTGAGYGDDRYGCIPYAARGFNLPKGTNITLGKSSTTLLTKYPSGEEVAVGDVFYAYCVPKISGILDASYKFQALIRVAQMDSSSYTLVVENQPVKVVSAQIVTSLSASNNDKQLPTAKAVYDLVAPIEQAAENQVEAVQNIIKGQYLAEGYNVQMSKNESGTVITATSDIVTIDQPITATQGQLDAEDVALLQANMDAYIVFAGEAYYLNGKEHTSGYLTYTNVEYESGETKIKTITITLSTLGWVMTENVVADKSYVDNLVGDIDTLLTNLNSGSGV